MPRSCRLLIDCFRFCFTPPPAVVERLAFLLEFVVLFFLLLPDFGALRFLGGVGDANGMVSTSRPPRRFDTPIEYAVYVERNGFATGILFIIDSADLTKRF